MKKKALDELLEEWVVIDPAQWDNPLGPKGWYAVANGEDGIIAYFAHEVDALRFRMYEIGRILNG